MVKVDRLNPRKKNSVERLVKETIRQERRRRERQTAAMAAGGMHLNSSIDPLRRLDEARPSRFPSLLQQRERDTDRMIAVPASFLRSRAWMLPLDVRPDIQERHDTLRQQFINYAVREPVNGG